MRTAAAFSPCNITGFFRIHDHSTDPTQNGSTGAGIALSNGVTTRVAIKRARRSRVSVEFNGRPLARTSVSSYVVHKLIELDGRSWDARVSHKSRLPIGCGYGTSGAGTLGLSLALNESLSLALSSLEVAQIAHVSEVKCRTGLGTVSSVFSGGLTIRVEPGAPGVGIVRRIPLPPSLSVVSAAFGPLPTPRILGSCSIKQQINLCGRGFVGKFGQHPSYTNFLMLSRRFSDCLGLMSARLSRLINAVDSAGFASSMMMLGESVFSVLPDESANGLAETLRSKGLTTVVSKIAGFGAHLT